MATEKKISFSGVDNGLFGLMEKIKRTNEDIFNKTVAQARQFSTSGKEQLSFIEMQVKALERKNKILEQEKRLIDEATKANLAAINQQQIAGRITPIEATRQRGELIGQRREALLQAPGKLAEGEKMVGLLRELIETVKLTAREEISSDRKNVEKEILATEKTIRRKGAGAISDEEALVRATQKDLLQKPERQKSIFGPVLAANLATEAAKGIFRATQGVVRAGSGEQAAASLVSGVPLFGDATQRHIEEQFQFQVARNQLRGRTGLNTNFSRTDLGFSKIETSPIMQQIAESRGTAQGLTEATGRTLEAGRARSLDTGTLMQMFRDMRTAGSDMDVLQNVAQVINMVPELKENKTLTPEILQLQSQLLQSQKHIETVDVGMTSQMIGAFRSIGGSFADPRAGQNIGAIQRSLTQPQNEFARARSFQVLSQLNPNASFVELEKMRERGINEPGFLDATLKQLQREFGGDTDSMTLAFRSLTGLSTSTSEAVIKGVQSDPDKFKGFKGTEKELEKLIGVSKTEEQLKAEAKRFVAPREVEAAMQSDEFVNGVVSGLGESFNQTINKVVEAIGEQTNTLLLDPSSGGKRSPETKNGIKGK